MYIWLPINMWRKNYMPEWLMLYAGTNTMWMFHFINNSIIIITSNFLRYRRNNEIPSTKTILYSLFTHLVSSTFHTREHAGFGDSCNHFRGHRSLWSLYVSRGLPRYHIHIAYISESLTRDIFNCVCVFCLKHRFCLFSFLHQYGYSNSTTLLLRCA